jgi:hypothetical protein
MALLFLDSFDHYTTDEIGAKYTVGSSTIDVGEGRCGSNAMHLWQNSVSRGLPFGSAGGAAGFAFRIWSRYSAAFTIPTIRIANLQAEHLIVQWQPDGSIEVVQVGYPNHVLGASSPGLFNMDTWYYVELQWLIHLTAGAVTLRVNNVTYASVTGVRTVGDVLVGTPAAATVTYFGFLCPANREYFIDDLYVLDDTGPAPLNGLLGDCRVEYLKPRAAGASQEWPVVVGSSGHHWLAVNDNAIPDEDGSYVEANAPGLTDTNLYQPTGLPTGNPVFGAQLSLYAKKTEVGPRVIAPVVNAVAGTPIVGASYDSYQYHSTPYGTNPATGSAWTVATINAIDAGVTVVT